MKTGQASIKEKQQAIQRDYLAAFFGRDDAKLEQIRGEAKSLGMCVHTDDLCDDDRCYCFSN